MLIAVSQRNDSNKHGRKVDSLEANYVEFLEKFGAELIIIPNYTNKIEEYFKLPIKGVVLTGGNAVSPKLYGQSAIKDLAISDKRDNIEKILIEKAIKNKIPVLGICRGMQFVNVYFGGSLSQDINGKKQKIEHVGQNHLVEITEAKLGLLFKKKSAVNSYHNQGIFYKNLCPDLKVFAKSEDGLIEGFFHKKYAVAGIQWHPERENSDKSLDELLIKNFLKNELFWEKR